MGGNRAAERSDATSVEKAVELQPDVVLFSQDSYPAARDAGLIDTLAKVNIPSVIIDFRQQPLETTVPSILLVGRLYGQETAAQAVADYYTQQINLVFARVDTLERSMTVLMALHDLNLAARFVDRLLILHQGRSYAEGQPADVLTEMMLWQVYGIEARVERDADDLPRITPIRSVRDRVALADERILAGALA